MNYLTLVNKNNLIRDSFYNGIELVEVLDILNDKTKVEKTTYKAFLELKEFIKEKLNAEIGVDSAFRSKEQQRKLYESYSEKYGKDYADTIVAPVGTSEHHTGLAIDLSIKVDGKFLIENDDFFKEEKTFLKIHKIIHKYGFILRYPKNKETQTGYPYEPWHIRYVGKIPAKIIYENNLTLEEYLNNYSGILVVNKEKGMTSRDVVNKVSKILGIKKIGHTGTLDPMAEGVLVLTIGKATKIGELLTAYEKEYISEVVVGKLTDTLDITGKVIKEKEPIAKIDYKNLIKSFKKTYFQEVPIYSATKVNGKKLYEYARTGIDVELPKKEVTIKEIELLEEKNNSFKFKCLVSKGTYIRSLIRDMGESIDECFVMNHLTRTKQGDFFINHSYTLEKIKNNQFKIYNVEEVLKSYPTINISNDKLLKQIKNGCVIDNIYNIEDKVLFKYNDKVIAIYEKDKNLLKSWKML